MPPAPTFALTPQLVAAHAGARVICLAAEGFGRRFALYEERPGPALNLRARRSGRGVEWCASEPRVDLPSGSAHVVRPVEASPALIRVDVVGPLEQRAGYEGECGAWLDGHDAVADRLCAAFPEGDVLFVIDSPGGAAAEIPANVRRALEAKAAYGRRCTGFGKPMIGSAAMWWATALCDELYGEADSQFGSIGARGEHVDISGMMAREGIKKTYFADPADKIAWAPEFPLGPVGEARGNRDVKLAADAFRAAVCASQLGQDMGLTPEYLIELGADMLTGENAVAGGLAHGVEPFETVVAYALSLAESEEKKAIEGEGKAAVARAAKLRASAHAPRRAA